MKPLYLDGTTPLRVLLDGPGLRVRAAGTADRLFPLRRLSRVVVCGRVDWTTEALLACAQADVPVRFLRRDGDLLARVQGEAPRKDWLRLEPLLAAFLDSPGGVVRYRGWVEVRAEEARRELVYEAQRGPWPTAPELLAQLLHERARRYARSAELKRFDGQVRALAKIHVETQLHELGLDPDAAGLLVHDVRVVDDLAGILLWTLQNAKLTWLKRLRNGQRRRDGGLARPGWVEAIRFVAVQDAALDRRFTDLIRHLQLFLLDSGRRHGLQ
jgi:CRISPR associated protein Cas1